MSVCPNQQIMNLAVSEWAWTLTCVFICYRMIKRKKASFLSQVLGPLTKKVLMKTEIKAAAQTQPSLLPQPFHFIDAYVS